MSEQALTAADFAAFFQALWDKTPFPWQSALAEQVLADADAWPQAITLPTAAGKTACLDIALFALAAQAHRQPLRLPLTAPRRIFFVVDRRVIVDEAFERASCMAMRLELAQDGILKTVADRLRQLAGGPSETPLTCFQLRGGIYRDDSWARSPIQPTIICSTVDQVGSRLLFRAYGRSFKAWHLQAGLVGNDSLILLDEAHCAQPFMETLHAVTRYRRWAQTPIPSPFQLVVMTATPPPGVPTFPDAEIRAKDRAHPVLRSRIEAAKPCRLVVAEKAQGKDAAKVNFALAEELVAQARTLVYESTAECPQSDIPGGKGAPAIVIFCNRVDTARQAHNRLANRHGERSVLLTGRMRPLDKDDTIAGTFSLLSAERSAQRRLPQPLYVVATQTLEVGANLDFDLLVSECADLSALRQRIGRLNRMGRPINARATIVVRSDQQKTDAAPDPIYGEDLSATWTWLNTQRNDQGEIALSIAALEMHDPAELAALAKRPPHAPVMLPAHVDALAQTSPEPYASPEVSLFLHGPQTGQADVQVCWRTDLGGDSEDAAARLAAWVDILSICPPASGELMPVPLMTFRRWLAGQPEPSADLGDVEGLDPDADTPTTATPRIALRWRGRETSTMIVDPRDVHPGDLYVIPVEIGGWETFGHIPDRTATDTAAKVILDLGDRANYEGRAKAVLRLTVGTLADWPDSYADSRQMLLTLISDAPSRIENDPQGLASDLQDALVSLPREPVAPEWTWLHAVVEKLARERHFDRCLSIHPCGGLVLTASKHQRTRCLGGPGFSHEDDALASGTVRCELDAHLRGVAHVASCFAAHLPKTLADDIQLAACHHDLGKADPRFQALLNGGNRWLKGPLLAKSENLPQRRNAYAKARDLSGYPRGGRHELLSVSLLENAPDILALAHDQDLVLHLISSHHGHCRPFAPVVDDFTPPNIDFSIGTSRFQWHEPTGLERLEIARAERKRRYSGSAERFWRLIRRYGWWGLAGLEAIVMLADHRRSEWEECQGTGDQQ